LVESGAVGEHEIQVLRALIELEESGTSILRKATYYKSYIVDGDTLIVVIDLGVGTSVPVFTKYARDIEQKLREKLGVHRVKLIPKANDVRSLASHLLYPTRVLGVNILWLPDGSVEYVVRVAARDYRRLGTAREVYERILREVIGKNVRIMQT
jgi:transcription antitermination factor NusA-like protein